MLLAALERNAGCSHVAVNVLRAVRIFDDEALNAVRIAFLKSGLEKMHRAALAYIAASGSSGRRCLRDFLYSRFGAIRRRAYDMLATGVMDVRCGKLCGYGKIIGVSKDFDILASIAETTDDFAIRTILMAKLPRTYESRLRNILKNMALRN